MEFRHWIGEKVVNREETVEAREIVITCGKDSVDFSLVVGQLPVTTVLFTRSDCSYCRALETYEVLFGWQGDTVTVLVEPEKETATIRNEPENVSITLPLDGGNVIVYSHSIKVRKGEET